MQPVRVDVRLGVRLTGGMFVMTIDQVDSRAHPDAVPQLLERLRDVPVDLPFERTAGDEVQGVLSDPRAVVDAWEASARDGRWTVGIGVGRDGVLTASSRASRGGPFLAAREAVEDAKGDASRVTVSVSPSAAGSDAEAVGADAQSVLRLLSVIIGMRSDAGWRVLDAARARPEATQAELARDLGISRQAVSKALRTNHAHTVDAGLVSAARLLAHTLELCPTGGGADGPVSGTGRTGRDSR
ncbi:hypothetical protein GCM10023159_19070 [Brevibacterium yomogidense]